ncbi:MAG: methylated-DNA--[protein]-cysteine S-methyltransferase [Clostridiales Family XIII bacterium]|nr:methylated-DNA--[protein]-cysteine S-methyltransferase [Clostridiales Family XIII bacterium]
MAYFSTTVPSPLGALTLACTADGGALTGLWLEGQKYHGDALFAAMPRKDDLPVFDAAKDWLSRYFAGEKPPVSGLPLRPEGTAFQQAVWRILLEIPYGGVSTYGDIARKIDLQRAGAPTSARAVGGAVGRNPISIIIPCHRVIGADGSLTGYAGGIEKKSWLLAHEGVSWSNSP